MFATTAVKRCFLVFIFLRRSLQQQALLAEISKGADVDVREAFRPLMPRSLRGNGGGSGGRALATPAVVAHPGGGKVGRAGSGATKRQRHEECVAGAGASDADSQSDAGGGDGGGSKDSEAAVLGDCRKAKGRGRREGDAPKVDESAVPSKFPGSDTPSGMNGSCVRRCGGAESAPTREGTAAPFSGSSALDTHNDVDGAAATAAATAAAAGVVADPADAKMLSGCAVSFRHEDFVTEEHADHLYDVVCLFSVVKWMHLNGGDEAVREVFQKAYCLLRSGGRLILEPQVGMH